MKYEQQVNENKEKKKEQKEEENDTELSSTNYTKFLEYFKVLPQIDKEQFQNILAQKCEVKGMKKNDKISLPTANIKLKEKALSDIKK